MAGTKVDLSNVSYIQCNDYKGNNTPQRSFNLRSNFVRLTELSLLKNFHLVTEKTDAFNGFSSATFDMDISLLLNETSTILGSWTAQMNSPINITDKNKTKLLKQVQKFRVATILNAPYVIKDPNSPHGYKGYSVDVLNEILKFYDYEYEIKHLNYSHSGRKNKNGEWNSIIGEIVSKRADIGLGTVSVVADREIVVDFTIPFMDLSGISIMMLRPAGKSSYFKFINVVEVNVWITIFLAYLFTSFILCVFNKWSPCSVENKTLTHINQKHIPNFNVRECLWFCLTSLTSQGGGEPPSNISGKLIAASWWLFG